MKWTAIVLALVFFLAGCVTGPKQKDDDYSYTKVFPKEYGETWKVLIQIMEDEFMFPIKEKNEVRGVIKTDWISVIRIRGTLRWNVKIILDRVSGGTQVKLYDRVEEPSKVLGKMSIYLLIYITRLCAYLKNVAMRHLSQRRPFIMLDNILIDMWK